MTLLGGINDNESRMMSFSFSPIIQTFGPRQAPSVSGGQYTLGSQAIRAGGAQTQISKNKPKSVDFFLLASDTLLILRTRFESKVNAGAGHSSTLK